MAPQTLRPYQRDGLDRILAAYKAGARRVLAVLPTAGGKTTVFGSLTADLRAPVLINVHRRELADQAANRLREFGVQYGVIMAGELPNPTARVQIASVQSLVRRAHAKPRANLVICDEAHLSTASTWETIRSWYPNARHLGVTATPWRLGGKPLVGAYDEVVVIATPRELREQGHLSPYVGFSYKAPDLEGIGEVGEDYDQQRAAAAMSAIAGDIVEQWLAHARDLSTVVFACTVEHSQQLAAQFRAAGVTAEHLDGNTPVFQRKAVLARVASGQTQVLCNVGIAVEGLDIPRLKCCVLARPTMSLSRAIQMMGRVRRPWGGLTARIHDHAFVIGQHGLPDADRDYTLHSKAEKPKSLSRCPECLAYYEPGTACDGCGKVTEPQPRERQELQTVDAEQFDFASEDERIIASIPAVEVVRPPVQVEWNTVGRVVEGVYLGAEETPVYAPADARADTGIALSPKVLYVKVRHMVRGSSRTYSLPGGKHLNALMRGVRIDQAVLVRYLGEVPVVGGRTMRRFEVEAFGPDEVSA